MIGPSGHVLQPDEPVRARDVERSVTKLQVVGARLQQMGGNGLGLLHDLCGRGLQCVAADHGASGGVGSAPEGDLLGVALDEADLVHGDAKPVRDALAVGGRMGLAVGEGAGDDGDAA
jgi:hypothetical protein